MAANSRRGSCSECELIFSASGQTGLLFWKSVADDGGMGGGWGWGGGGGLRKGGEVEVEDRCFCLLRAMYGNR